MMQHENPTLLELQQWMKWVITDPRGVTTALTEVPNLNLPFLIRYLAPERNCLGFIMDTPPILKCERLDIYAEAYFTRLLESFTADFEIIFKVVGEDVFSKLTADYLKAFPSTVPNISEVGSHMEVFLLGHEYSEDLPFLPELGRLEWAVIQTFYADEVPNLDGDSIKNIPESSWQNAEFVIDPAVQLFEGKWPVDQLWNAIDDTELLKRIAAIASRPTYSLVSRRFGVVHVEEVNGVKFYLLSLMKQGFCLGDICEKLAGLTLDPPPLLEWFREWIECGIIRKIHTKENES